jgi:NADPH:quinone reductase-like Zn-dependent oxidoreductase
MKAIVRDTYGSAGVLELRDIDKPEIGDEEVLVRVRAAGVDQGVWHVMTGLPYPIRLAGYGLRAPKTPVLGADVAGVVEAVGSDVTRFQPGDEVFGIAKGSYAQYARARADRLAPKPANLSLEQAAVVAISGLTALQAVRDHGRVESGQKVLVIGASGGVGTFAVQIAKSLGAHVTGVCSTRNVEMVRSIGADTVIDYTKDDFTKSAQRYDVILDNVGNHSLSDLRRVVKPEGRYVMVGGPSGRWLDPLPRAFNALVQSWFVDQEMSFFMSELNKKDMTILRDLMAAGKVTPVIDRTYKLNEAAEAIRYLEAGRARGKVIVTMN